MGKILPKIEEISDEKAHKNTRKLIQNISTITYIFLNQKRVNVCEHMTKIASLECFGGAFQKLSLCHVFTYIHSLLIEKDLCDCQNLKISFRVFVCAFPSEIYSIFGKSFPFPFPYFVLFILGTFLSHGLKLCIYYARCGNNKIKIKTSGSQ